MIFGRKDEVITLKTIQDLCDIPTNKITKKEEIEIKKIYFEPVIKKEIKAESKIVEEPKEIKPIPKIETIKADTVKIEKKKVSPEIKEKHFFKRLSFNNGGEDILWL